LTCGVRNLVSRIEGCLIAARDSKYRNNLTTPIDPEIEYDKNVCNHDKLEGGCDFHALDSICEGMSPACITNPCPEVLLVADCRCSVGDFFSDVEKKQFEEKTEILSQPNFKLQSENDLGLSDEKAAYAHEALRDEFDGLKKYPNRYGHIVFMVKCLEIADRVKRAAKNKQRSSPAESTVEANVDSIETTGELSSVTIFGISDNVEKKLRKILDDYHNRINETDVEKWDRLSREKFDDMGWTELAKMELEKQEGKTPSKKAIRRLSDQIRKRVGLHRSKYQ